LSFDKIKRQPTQSAKLQRKIFHAEQQLVKAAACSMESSSSQTPEIITPPKMVSEKRMIAPGARDAPRFNPSKPEELRRFISSMEDLWKEAGVTSAQEKKSMIGKYADQDSEEEWAAFNTFEAPHSWEAFKDELLENYPEAAAAERGTPARIRQICKAAGRVRLGDIEALSSFRRSFMAEAKKLQKPPAAMGNRELVELFIGCLSDSLASAVLQYLGNKPTDDNAAGGSKNNANASAAARRPEDKYDLDDVCRAATQVSENSQGMFNLMNRTEERGVLLFSQPVAESVSKSNALADKLHELEGEQAQEKDRLVNLGKTLEARMGGLEEMIKSLIKLGQANEAQSGANCKSHDATSNPAQRWGGKSLDHEKCFWCGLFGHFQADCEDMKNQVRIGNIKLNQEGKPRLKDGSFIPKFPAEASLKERVEKHYARKPSQYYYGEYEDQDPTPSSATSILSQLLGTSNDSDKRAIAQLKAELDLRKREEALELKQKLLEQSEKKLEHTSGSNRTTNVLELLGQLTDEELVAIKAAKSGFV